jgi:pimeloyl-ACP methyl ester carboxylesterase
MRTLQISMILLPLLALVIGSYAQETSEVNDWADESPHQVRFVTVTPGIQLEVLDWGGNGDGIVFLAGLSMNAHSFDDFAPRFKDELRVVAITRRGHGASTWPDSGYSMDRLVEDIRIVLDTLGMQRVILAGNSFAGAEITRFASEYPQRVAGLVYIDAAHDGTLIERLRIFEVCPTWPEFLKAWKHRFENPEAFRRTQLHETDDGALVPYASETAIAQIAAGESTPEYSTVQAPALAVYHTPRWVEDTFGGEVVLSEECVVAMQRYIYEGIAGFAAVMKQARIVAIEDTQHLVHLVSPDALEEIMRRWITSISEEQ